MKKNAFNLRQKYLERDAILFFTFRAQVNLLGGEK